MRYRSRLSIASIAVVLASLTPLGPLPCVCGADATVRDLLEAEESGEVAVRYIPNDSRSAQIIVTNRTTRPLTLRLPDAFVGVPVLAQMMGGGMGEIGRAHV